MIAGSASEPTATPRPRSLPSIAAPALALGAATFLVRGGNANAFCWGAVQVLLVVIAAEDLRTRRIPNALTGPAVLVAIALRIVFASSELPATLIAGLATFIVFLGLAIVARGGFGMGDVKLAGLLGVLLGASVLPALVLGTVVGAVASLVVLLRSRSRRTAFAYGPYLCFGAAVVILVGSVPHLV